MPSSPAPHSATSTSHLNTRLALSRQPLPASTKNYLIGSRPDIRVPVRDIQLTNGAQASVYDTSGPYTDPQAQIDVRRGLPALRQPWIDERGDTESYEGRLAHILDDGGKHDARDSERIEQLRREAAALQRPPRRAKPGANVSKCTTRARASSRPRWNTSPCAKTAAWNGRASIWRKANAKRAAGATPWAR